ncbi:MAG: ferredoxin [Pseudomonadota bacterium]|nr:ferredoxin [Gammaproteobacteria bacterium]MBU1559139.1 ferredoxin [Gammaproteobacteria bacterium]MBU1629385.1 ferredoxin [Gammaproteobacteria bacterium]MBU1926409.1 ferredoxin [Gammaproteobacteria bacterium]MBU2545520.1 ferredoxin [Gammaproteobacteria bacterium]
MADVNDKNALNVPGPFYVDENCISCGMCCDTASECFKMDDDTGVAYVFKQPKTPEETAECQEAKESCPVEAIGDDGK